MTLLLSRQLLYQLSYQGNLVESHILVNAGRCKEKHGNLIHCFTINNWRHGEDDPVLIIDNRIDWFVPNDVQVVMKMTVFLRREDRNNEV